MSLRNHLNLSGITITRTVTTTDDYGDPVTTSTTSIISVAAIWSPTQGDRRISDKIAKTSTHVLVIETGDYTFTDDDKTATYDSVVYNLVGHQDDVSNRGVLTMIGMERET